MTEQATYVRTAHIALDELTPFPGNAKRGNVGTILQSLRRNGQYRSLVVREITDGPLIVLAGNHTMQALGAHGAGDCGQTAKTSGGTRPCGICQNDPAWEPGARCEIVQCDQDTARRINLVDNRSAELGEYDRDALAELLSCVDDDYVGTGYTDEQVDDIIAAVSAPTWAESQAAELAAAPFTDERRRDTGEGDSRPDAGDAAPAKLRTLARGLPIDAIFSMGRLCSITLAAYEMGFLPGIISTSLSSARDLAKRLPNVPLGFMDNEWHGYDHATHVAAVRETRPKYATVRDAMTKSQCEAEGVEYYPLARILEMAEEVGEYAENVIVIPKYDCLDKIPEKCVLGFSVPTTYGGTPMPIQAFTGRRIHLLGGPWAKQRHYLGLMGDDIVSFDNNHLLRVSEFGDFTYPDGSRGRLADMSEKMPRTWQAAAILSLASIRDELNAMFHTSLVGAPALPDAPAAYDRDRTNDAEGQAA